MPTSERSASRCFRLTSDEAIGAYAYGWSQVQSVETFYEGAGPGAKPLPMRAGYRGSRHTAG